MNAYGDRSASDESDRKDVSRDGWERLLFFHHPGGKLCVSVEAQLAIDSAKMRFDRALADTTYFGDFAMRFSLRDEQSYLAFAQATRGLFGVLTGRERLLGSVARAACKKCVYCCSSSSEAATLAIVSRAEAKVCHARSFCLSVVKIRPSER